MLNSRDHIRHCLLYEYQMGHSVKDATRNICAALRQDVLSQATAYRWYLRFDNGDYSLEDQTHPGRPVELDIDALQALVKSDPRQTTRCLASALGCDQSTVDRHLNELGYRNILGALVPHVLSPEQKNHRVDICMSLFSKQRRFEWLDYLITGDEKWVLYVNMARKREWIGPGDQPSPTSKAELHPKKVMLCLWWDVRGIIYWELLPTNTTITATVYSAQLERLKEKIKAVRPKQDKFYFLHDNARPHIALSVRQKLIKFNWELLPHPPYSPDLAPSDYHLFRSLSNNLREKIFDDQTDLVSYLDNFFLSQPKEFYRNGIHSLSARWQQVIESGGEYIID